MIYALLLALIALTGYVYCHVHEDEKKRLAWHAKQGGLYYRYAAFGLCFTIFGYLAYLCVYALRPSLLVEFARLIAEPLNNAMPGSWPKIHLILGTTISSVFFSAAIGKVAFKFSSRDRMGLIYKEIKKTEDSFSRVLLIAMNNRMTILVNLDGNKVYVGHPVEFYSPYVEHSWLQLVPVMSGHRKEDTKELILDTDYQKSINEFVGRKIKRLQGNKYPPRLDDFALTINMNRIQSFTIFDIPLYVDKVIANKKSNPA